MKNIIEKAILEVLDTQALQIDKLHAVSEVWANIYAKFDELTEIRNSKIYALLLDFINNPTNEMAHKVNNTWMHEYGYSDCCYFKANVDNNQWSLAIMSNDRHWDPCLVKYTNETGFRLDDDINALKEKLNIQSQKFTQAINSFINGKEV